MSVEKNIQLIETILAQRRKYKTAGQRLAYERGLLTGILARLATEDSAIRAALWRLIEKKK